MCVVYAETANTADRDDTVTKVSNALKCSTNTELAL